MVSIDQFKNGLHKYIETDMLPHLRGFKKIGLHAYLLLAENNVLDLVENFKTHPAVSVLQIIDENNMIDIDRMYNAIAPNFIEKQKVKIPIVGEFTFDRNDLEKLYQLIRESN